MPVPGSRLSPPKPLRRSRLTGLLLLMLPAGPAAAQVAPYQVAGDGIPASLTGLPGDAARGRASFGNRQVSTCLLCHADPSIEAPQATIGTSLRGVGTRLTPAQIRLQLVDARRLDPDTVMPSFYAVAGLRRVAQAWQDRPVLTAAQIEDLVAFLATLQTA
jgi:L-cysteine S-thiosulfotransferase